MSNSIKMKKQIGYIFLTIVIMLIALVIRLFWVQFVMGEELRQKAFAVRFRNVEVKAKRGIIYDTKGRSLAISISTDSFYAIPAQVKKSKKEKDIANKIAGALDIDENDVLNKITKSQAFVWIQRHVPEEKAQKLKSLELPGISFVEEPERFYPKDKLLANVLGFSGIDNQGLNGVEISYDKVLRGISGTIMVEYDAKGQEIPDALQKYVAPQDGNSIYLTIDETIQYIVERELDEIVKVSNPKKAGAIVMDPKTGRILAMAMRPTFSSNDYQNYDQSLWRNFLISDAYEPGSTFKTVTMSGALDEGVVKLNDRFYCGGFIKVGKEKIKCWKLSPGHGSQTFVEGVQNSCNPVFVTLGLREGVDVFYRYLYGFGFGKKTGIELPGEAIGILVGKKRCKEIDLATMSIGQANAVTPIQLVTACAAMANDGKLMKPQIVEKIQDNKGNIVKTVEPEVVRQVIAPETAHQVMDILELVVSNGTGKNAYVEGYRVGGKTGTAQKIIPGGGYSKTEYVGSFLGVAPVNDPKLVCLVVVDTPEGIYYGGTVAAPAFRNIIRDSLRYLQVPAQVEPDKISGNNKESLYLPNLVGSNIKDAVNTLANNKIKVDVLGDGTTVKMQLPLANTKVLEGSKVVLYTSVPAGDGEPELIVIPDLTGKNVGEVKELTKMLNLNFKIRGSGIVIRQEPEPGERVQVGGELMVFMGPKLENSVQQLGP
ncbi:MAG: stage V sporulation protein D [Clostridia bacterium]|nr:stage V sporulation protein D [Clostridia bacterium]